MCIFSYFLSNIALSTAKQLSNKQYIGEWQIESSVTHIKQIMEIAGFVFREKDMRNMCVLNGKFRETTRSIRNGMLQKHSKFILRCLVVRHHSMKVLRNFDYY